MAATTDFRITRLSKVIAALLFALWAVSYFVPETVSYLALVPGRTLPCVWNLVTAGFVTTNPIKMAFEVLAVLFFTRLVEPVYGSKEYLKFLLVVDLSTNICVLAGVYVYFAAAQDERKGDILYKPFCGFHGLLAGLIVAVKQVMPEHEAKLFGVVKFTFKFLPLLYVLGSVGLCVALKQYSYVAFIVLGTYNSWLYLRFFQQQPDSQHKGDSSDDFRFSGFFPSILAVLLDPIGVLCSTVFRLRHQPAETKAPFAGAAQYSLGSDNADANRRRERGAKALEERLMKKPSGAAEGDVEAVAEAPLPTSQAS